MGIIHKPFNSNDIEHGKTYFGTLEAGVFMSKYPCMEGERKWEVIPTFKERCDLEERTLKVVTSKTPKTLEEMEPFFSAMKSYEIVSTGGSGGKTLHMIEKECDAYVYGPTLGLWDVCAPEAIVKALGGAATDYNGEPYKYVGHAD
jgi:3'-phosphoadenosine 5'-phosphosulfate (PAPS) 3'-phosphatase